MFPHFIQFYQAFRKLPLPLRYCIVGGMLALVLPLIYLMMFFSVAENGFRWNFWYVLLSAQIVFIAFGYLLGKRDERLQQAHQELNQRVWQVTQELEKKHQQLLHSTKLATIGELAASVAHELRQPLTIITGYCEEILLDYEAQLAPEAKEMLGRILEQGQVMANISSTLRDFSHKSTPEFRPLSVNTLLEKIASFYSPQFEKRQIQFHLELTNSLPTVMAESGQIQQVLMNLINNAVDVLEAHEGGVLTVRSFLNNEHHLIVQVSNSGPLIPEEDRPRVFTPFFTTKPAGKGTGLGLSISQTIMENHGGILRLEEEAKETTFTLVFPVLVMPTVADVRFFGQVLIIDDSPDIRTILSKKLQRLGLQVDEASDYKTAVATIATKSYDLIFSDFNLSGKHGGHILRQVRLSYPDLPFYFISRYFSMVRPELKEKFLSIATGWVEKPFSEQRLMEVLLKHLEHQSNMGHKITEVTHSSS